MLLAALSRRCAHVAIGLALNMGCRSTPAPAPVARDAWEQESVLVWGPYRVKFFHSASQARGLAQIQDERGSVLREVRGARIVGPELLEPDELLRDFTGDGVAELRLLDWSGGAYCCYTDYLFDRAQGLENILIFEGQEFHLLKGRRDDERHRALWDLDGDGRAELVVENDAIQSINGSTHGPTTLLVLVWDGNHYVDASRRYLGVHRERALMYRQSIALDAKGRFSDELSALDAAAGYYASSILAGEETAARSWLLAHGAAAGARWLEAKSAELRRLIAVKRVTRSRSRQLGAAANRASP